MPKSYEARADAGNFREPRQRQSAVVSGGCESSPRAPLRSLRGSLPR
jgi:hypothetical protein